jgi:hypothetical protein
VCIVPALGSEAVVSGRDAGAELSCGDGEREFVAVDVRALLVSPPLVITWEQIDHMTSTLSSALDAVMARH